MTYPPHQPMPGRLPDDQRAAILQRVITDMSMRGWRCEAQDPATFRAVFVGGQPVNHILHLLIAVFTCFLWAPVWILLALLGGEKRQFIHIDDYGNLIGLQGPTVANPGRT